MKLDIQNLYLEARRHIITNKLQMNHVLIKQVYSPEPTVARKAPNSNSELLGAFETSHRMHVARAPAQSTRRN
jgi:hypothetical protein